MNKKINKKNKKSNYNSNIAYHQRFNSQNKINLIDFKKIKKLAVSWPKSEKSEIKKDININFKNKEEICKDAKLLKFKTTTHKKAKKTTYLNNKKKKNSHIKFDFKNIYTINKPQENKINKKKHKVNTKSEYIFKDLTQNYFENLCNLRVKTTNLSAIWNNEIFIILNKIENQRSNTTSFFDNLITTLEELKSNALISLDIILKENQNHINNMLKKIENNSLLIENLLNEYKNNRILDNDSLIKILNNFTIKFQKPKANFNLEQLPDLNFDNLKNSFKKLLKPKKLKDLLNYNTYLDTIKLDISNYFTKLNIINSKLEQSSYKRKKGTSMSMALGEYIISNQKYKFKIHTNNNRIEEEVEEKEDNLLSSLKNNIEENKISCSSITLKCSEQLESPIKDII